MHHRPSMGYMPSSSDDGVADHMSLHQSSDHELPAEIPDSEEDLPSLADDEDSSALNSDFDERENRHNVEGGGDTESNLLEEDHTEGGKYRYPLHQPNINTNGCLPTEAPLYCGVDLEMDEEATQPATQQFVDPRRFGTKSMLSLQDEADVLCILMPTSRPAMKAAELVAGSAPQHILQNHWLKGIPEASYAVKAEDTRATSPEDGTPDIGPSNASTSRASDDGTNPSARDIALRMSSRLRDPRMGFVFGRNVQRCDIVMAFDVERLSNCHFRIYLNKHGVLMLQDTSTNGTYVDKTLLKGNGRDRFEQPVPSSRTINNGSIIELPCMSSKDEEWIRFIVRIPSRSHGNHEYQCNLTEYIRYIQQNERQAQVAAAAQGRLPPAPPMPFRPLNQPANDDSYENGSILAAATGDYNHGMHWDGGIKYNVVNYIGKGAFAMVFKISGVSDGEVYAAKQIEKRRFIKDGQLGSKVHHEISIMERLRHPNIVQFIEYQDTPSHVYIIMEYVPMGDLTTYTGSGTVMNEYMAQVMASQICAALRYLHQQKITHRDIKPDNILVAGNQPHIFKLSDFGLSKIVKDEETFMKTFCGTILYCAPEIYPGFQRVRLGMPPKRSRQWEQPREETLPYKHSVDTWGIAAVLFHLLCGRPAWTGTTENQGAVMLENIMRTPVEWERLEQAGVSDLGIQFLERMLVIEPGERATEDEQLRHPWITQVVQANDSEMETEEGQQLEEDPGLDASQLSIADHYQQQETDGEYEEVDDPRQTKRVRGRGENEYQAPSGSASGAAQQHHTRMTRASGANRLFGEISESALRSSGVLGQDANVALDLPMAASHEGYSNISSVDPNYPAPESTIVNPPNASSTTRNMDPSRHRRHGRHPHAQAAPSLLGTEALVDQLNMASPGAGASEPSANGRDESPSHSPGTRASRTAVAPSNSHTGHKAATSPQARRATAADDRWSQSARKVGERKGSNTNQDNGSTRALNDITKGSPQDSNDAQQPSTVNNGGSSIIPTELNSAEFEEEASIHTNNGTGSAASDLQNDRNITVGSGVGPMPFKEPPFRFGNLVPVAGSIPTVKIKIANQINSFGRDPSSTFPHPNLKADRVPKNAMDITMHYPGIDADIERGSVDWHLREDLTAIISTRTNHYIKVNGVRLMRGSGCWLYGKLHTGDIVTIFEPSEGRKPTNETEKQFLKFRCEFFVGASKAPRSEDDKFVVLKEERLFREAEMRKSLEIESARSTSNSV